VVYQGIRRIINPSPRNRYISTPHDSTSDSSLSTLAEKDRRDTESLRTNSHRQERIKARGNPLIFAEGIRNLETLIRLKGIERVELYLEYHFKHSSYYSLLTLTEKQKRYKERKRKNTLFRALYSRIHLNSPTRGNRNNYRLSSTTSTKPATSQTHGSQ